MNRRKSGLGSGLDALFSGEPETRATAVRSVPVGQIQPNPHQPRTQFDEAALDELAASIREHGIIQPLIVSEHGDGYTLIAGERRWRAAQRAGLEQVPVLVREAATQQLVELALIENVQRADLNALEEARAYQALVDDFKLSDGEIARRLGKGSREAITNTRRLLQLDADAQAALLQGRLTAGHGRALLKVKQPAHRAAMLMAILDQGMSVRAAERLADLVEESGNPVTALAALQSRAEPPAQKQHSAQRQHKQAATHELAAEDEEVRRTLERILSTPVSVSRTEREVRITIAFHTEEKLQEFFDYMNNIV